jgi:hypothetical protein
LLGQAAADVAPQHHEPWQEGQRRQDRPQADPGPPATERVGDRHGRDRGDRRATHQRGTVERAHRRHPVREVHLDQRRQDHVADRSPGEADGAAQQEEHAVVDHRPQSHPGSDQHQNKDGGPVQAEATHGAGRADTEDRETQHRQGRQDAADRGGHAEVVADRLEHNADAAHGDPQVGGEQDDRRADEDPAAGRRGPGGGSRHDVILRARPDGSATG